MFKWLNKRDSIGSIPQPARGIGGNLTSTVQRSFARGVDCNMKIVLKGDRNTGKSCLLKQLQGAPFTEAYSPTPEIEVGNISWKYKTTDDIVKVEVWDVVDVGTKKDKKTTAPLKFGADADKQLSDELPALDAKFVDVYKGTHGVIILMDMTKPWTFQYVERELPLVPKELPVLILNNFRDRGDHRQVNADEVCHWAQHMERSQNEDSAPVFYAESALIDGFGLMFVYRFLNLPYLRLQKAQLLARLAATNSEMGVAQQELELSGHGSDEQDYTKFLQAKSERKRNRKKSNGTPDPDQLANEMSKRIQASTPPKDTVAPKEPTPTGPTTKRSMFGGAGSKSNSRRSSRAGTPTLLDTGTPVEDVADFNPAANFNPDDFFGDVQEPVTVKAAADVTPVVVGDDSDTEDEGNPMIAADGSDIEVSDIEIESGDELNQISDVEESEEEEEEEDETPRAIFEEFVPTPVAQSMVYIEPASGGDDYVNLEDNHVPVVAQSNDHSTTTPPTTTTTTTTTTTEVPPRRKPSGGLSFAAYGSPTVAQIVIPPPTPVEDASEKSKEKGKKKKNKKGDKDKDKDKAEDQKQTPPAAPVIENSLDSWLDDEVASITNTNTNTTTAKSTAEDDGGEKKKKKKKKKEDEEEALSDTEKKKKKKKPTDAVADDGDKKKKKKKKKKETEGEVYETI